MQSLEELWELVRDELKRELSEVIYSVWIKDIEFVSFENGVIKLAAVEFKKRIIEQKFSGALSTAFEKVLGFPVEIALVEPAAEPEPEDEKPEGFNSDYSENTFDTFVVGSSNKFAHAAALAVAQNPGGTYNPLFIYGSSGLGKTHLLNAICHEIRKNRPEAKIIFTQAEEFTNELVRYIAERNTIAFHEKYRNADVLLVDDVQFIAGREQTQEEFFHTFNALKDHGNQIVLASDRPPKAMTILDDRLRNRFEWGLLADIQAPDIETRMAIVKRKAQLLNFDLPDDVVQYIAEKLKTNIRQLEGAVKKMQAFVMLHGSPKNTVTAQNAIKDILSESRPEPVTVEKVIDEVARMHGASSLDIVSKKRDSKTSHMRQIAMYVVSEVTGMSTKAIGQAFGGRDHSTVIYALNEIRSEIEISGSTRAMVDDIIKNVQEQQ